MRTLILTITGNKQDEKNTLNNIEMYSGLSDGFDYKVYSNYSLSGAIKQDFTYFNEMFFRLKEVILQYDYLMLLDGDDRFAPNKLSYIQGILETHKYNYIHNRAYYNSKTYDYQGVNHNNSCITIKTDVINFDLFKNTKSLSDYLLWLPIFKNYLILDKTLTYINLRKMDYTNFHDYMYNRYVLRFNDLKLLLDGMSENTQIHKRLRKEFNKYDSILNHKIQFSDPFTCIYRNKGIDWFIKREYNLIGD